MPRIFNAVDISPEEKEVRKDYFDRHAPVIVCEDTAVSGEKFRVKVRVGTDYKHPDDADHYISFIQLWNIETFLAEIHFGPGVMGSQANQVEVDFFIVPKNSMQLTALSNCTKHGLWQSKTKEVKVVHNSQEPC